MIAPAIRRVEGVRAVVLLGGLAAAMTLRVLLAGELGASSLPAGAVFAAVLLGLCACAGLRPAPGGLAAAALIGGAGALVLSAIPVWLRLRSGVTLPIPSAALFVPWALTVSLIAVSEELLLRGVLYDALARAGGQPAAVLLGAVAFALLHVPLYGWGVVPLDLGVGIWLGCLRAASGRVAAPALAHTLADLATWWLW